MNPTLSYICHPAAAMTEWLAQLGAWMAERDVCRSTQPERDYEYHKTVLLEESIHFTTPDDVVEPLIVDGTCGGAGHTELFLKNGARVLGIDRDPEALERASRLTEQYGDRLTLVEGNFSDIEGILENRDIGKVDGILVDLGVSSRQLDEPSRGFSFQRNGPLDMRMGRDVKETAADIVNNWAEDEIARILYVYGEERASRRIAAAICRQRITKPFAETLELADCISSVVKKTGRTHPATKSFQALRIAVNGELDALEALLDASRRVLKPGGRLAVISFHSLEDRLVKHFFKNASTPTIDKPEWPEPRKNPDYSFKLVTRKPVTAAADELAVNPRSRSAKLRVAQLLA